MHGVSIKLVLFLGWAGPSVVTALTAEAADPTTLVLLSLSDLASGDLFPEPAVTPRYFVFGSVLGLSSLVDSGDPRSGNISTLIF